jgi:Sulfotransferase family
MICKEYNCIFIHIPKVAGQSVEQFFLHLAGLTWKTRASFLLRRNLDPALGPRRLAHLTASEYVSCGHLTQVAFNSFYKFSFVRNPWDRIVSEYAYRRHYRKFDFKTFLFKRLPSPGSSDSYRHILPQHCFLYDENEQLLVDFIGRFENLQSDFEVICGDLGINSARLPHRNKAISRKHYSKYYDSESKEYVAELYKKDIKLFSYTFGA